MCEKCCEGVSKQNRKSKSFRFQECFGRGVQTESKRGKRNAAENHERAATYGPSKTMYTCRQSSARQHRSSRAAGIHDDISTPGGRWASHGGGGASDVDAPGSNFKFILRTNFQPRSRGHHVEIIPILFALARTLGNKGPTTSGQLLWFACWLFTGDLCGCVALLAVGCVLCTAVLM